MIRRTVYIETDSVNPYHNLALEETLLSQVKPGMCILYLWRNRHTVVIGRNQNSWKECRVGELERSGGHLARRLSGGGAVYHDLGNLNFTFLAAQEDYQVDRQLEVVKRAVESFGMRVEKTGRNDLTVKGRKFSGNAFYESEGNCYHHGTILISANENNLSRYLNVDPEKLKSKGVESVKSRVCNLQDFCPDLTVESMKKSLVREFASVYGVSPEFMTERDLPQDSLMKCQERYNSWKWRYGRKIPFTHRFHQRFQWGDFDLQMQVEGGVIQSAGIFSDGLDSEFYALSEFFPGMRYGRIEILQTMDDGLRKLGFSEEVGIDILRLLESALN